MPKCNHTDHAWIRSTFLFWYFVFVYLFWYIESHLHHYILCLYQCIKQWHKRWVLRLVLVMIIMFLWLAKASQVIIYSLLLMTGVFLCSSNPMLHTSAITLNCEFCSAVRGSLTSAVYQYSFALRPHCFITSSIKQKKRPLKGFWEQRWRSWPEMVKLYSTFSVTLLYAQ